MVEPCFEARASPDRFRARVYPQLRYGVVKEPNWVLQIRKSGFLTSAGIAAFTGSHGHDGNSGHRVHTFWPRSLPGLWVRYVVSSALSPDRFVTAASLS